MFQMWYPPPAVWFDFDSLSSLTHRWATTMWQVNPFEQHPCNAVERIVGFHNDPLYTNDERTFLLMRSLLALVWANHYLELQDPKLLGWFQCLTEEDRTLIQREGGYLPFLKKHPALVVTRQYVYVKPNASRKCVPPPTAMSSSRYPTFYGAFQCQNCRTSCPFGTKKCSHCGIHIEISEDKICVSENEKQLEMLPNYLREDLNNLTAQSDLTKQNITLGCTQSTMNTQKAKHRQRCDVAHPATYSKGIYSHAQCLSQLWQDAEKREDPKHFKVTTAQASFSLDMELDKQSQVHRNDYIQNGQLYDQMEKTDDCSLDQAMPEYYSFSSTSLDHTIWSDGSQSMEAGSSDSIMATKGSTQLSDEPSDAAMASPTSANSTDCFSCLSNSFDVADESGDGHEDLQKKQDSRYEPQIEEINLGSSKCGASVSVDQIIDACGDFRACFTSTCATEVDRIFQVENVATDTNLLAVSHEKDTQTVQMATSEKNTITEVYMSDLDVLAEEFIKLKEMEKELKRLRTRKSSTSPGGDHCRRVCGCDCAQQVRRAELRLLALQFVMCQQYCWRRYFTSPLGERAHQSTEALPESIAETLNTLQKDYHEMWRLILAGTPLDDLKPLSVDLEKITIEANYSPASVLEAHLDSFDSLGSTIRSGHRVDEESKDMRALNNEVCQDAEDDLDEAKGDGNKRSQKLFSHKKPKAFTKTTPGAVKDPSDSEAWFDAEEDLESPNQDGKMEKQNEKTESMSYKMEQKGTDEDESKQSSLLCITCLPDNVTEQEVLLWFEKYNVLQVCISTFSNNIRAAIVYLKSSSDAKAAVEDLNGRSLQGHTVQVVQLCRSALSEPTLSDQSRSTAETAGDGLGTKSVTTYSSSHGGPRCSVDRLTNVCDSPTASGTCVPQHYATMGSFDTIMARLSERHPNVGRQRIVDALLELRAKHQGFLSGLPLRSIVDMTSEFLSQASTPTST